ncbi:hypothetical protein BABINDRAFT_35437 [Babjeviella inositovora NRRL Y-12698]|uniref:Kynureninase n=1 Tax=Babjeviella inositovora NRRL Y-12698 TaxID=984486 RepID=A0A1E3QTD2_9ASCO|nr:uncharacterized protein BABINDRAFT_35437 [Babjeviella inositovora NRRL Y-12698]ODQ80197.1 hypothetical protein BABINDRAFT_35437 [Babjeviella inositovora NRRL Y-12698]
MSLQQAQILDARFATYKQDFHVPTLGSLDISNPAYDPAVESIYFCGNSLGLMPKATRQAVMDELDAWATRGVESHFRNARTTDWVDVDLPLLPLLAPLVGARVTEVCVAGTLTGNLNSLVTSFYRPQGKRTKILFEKAAFPSDYYAFLNQVRLRGYDASHLVQLAPRAREYVLRTEDILAAIDQHEAELALVCFSGIQYYTGQFFDIEAITRHAKAKGITVGWDLAHAVGNVELSLHDWDVDFAVWCSYKYLNSGPGAIAGLFVHETHTKGKGTDFIPRMAGWWGNNASERFKMFEKFEPIESALGFRQSNPSVTDVVAVKASLELFARAGGISTLREKGVELTNFLEKLLHVSKHYITPDASFDEISTPCFTIITPVYVDARGQQLSLLFFPHHDSRAQNVMERVFAYLNGYGIIVDERRPDVIRIAPLPLYNTFEEVHYTVRRFNEAFDKILAGEI